MSNLHRRTVNAMQRVHLTRFEIDSLSDDELRERIRRANDWGYEEQCGPAMLAEIRRLRREELDAA